MTNYLNIVVFTAAIAVKTKTALWFWHCQLGDVWYLDEVFIKINGVLHYLWRAVDQDGDELDILVQKRRNEKAAMNFFKGRQQERQMRRFKSHGQTQRFLSCHCIERFENEHLMNGLGS